jgi:hypothetical protein
MPPATAVVRYCRKQPVQELMAQDAGVTLFFHGTTVTV